MTAKKKRIALKAVFGLLIVVLGFALIGLQYWRSPKQLRLAVLRGNLLAVQRAIWLGADVNHQIDPNRGFVGLSGEIAILWERGYPALPAFGGITPLMYAAMGTDTEIAETLIEAGADLDLVNFDGWTALIIAVMMSDASMVDFLVDAGADPDLTAAANGETALSAAIRSEAGRLEKVKSLIAAGADLTAQNVAGMTPLIWTSVMGAPEIVQALLEAGADLYAVDNEDHDALHWADRLLHDDPSNAARLQVVELLTEAMTRETEAGSPLQPDN
ncbi:MAG: ankyrin repeat domain-containing protein [Pseudomonadales bacterium]